MMMATVPVAPLPWSDLDSRPWSDLGDEPVPVVVEDRESVAFCEGLLLRSLDQLFSLHSSLELRWEVWHWIFSIPFVSREYGVKPLRATLATAVDRMRRSNAIAIDPDTCHAVPVPQLGYREVRFRLSNSLAILPATASFEQVCLTLGLNPEALQDQIEEGLRSHGIAELIDQPRMGVRPKREAPAMTQHDLIDVDFSDIACFVVPATLRSPFARRPKPAEEAEGAPPRQAMLKLV